MKNPEQDKSLKISKLLWYSLNIELMALFIIAYYILGTKEKLYVNDNNFLLLYLSYFTVIIFIPLSFWIHKKLGVKSKNIIDTIKRSDNYLKSTVFRLALLEISGIITLISYYFSGFTEPLYMFGIVFVASLMSMPSLKQFNEDFNPDEENNDEISYN